MLSSKKLTLVIKPTKSSKPFCKKQDIAFGAPLACFVENQFENTIEKVFWPNGPDKSSDSLYP